MISGGGLVTKKCPILATTWTVAHQAPLSMAFHRQEYQCGLPFPSPGDLPDSEMEPRSSELQAVSCKCRQILYLLSHQGNMIGSSYL